MILFLYGPNSYRLREKEKQIIQRYQKIHKSGLNLIFLDGENLNFREFKDRFQQTTMFKEKRLIVLRNIFSNQEFKDEFLQEGEKLLRSEDIILISESKEIQDSDPLFKFLKEKAKTQQFKVLEGKELEGWIKKEFKKYNKRINLTTLKKLIEFVGEDLWTLSNEIKKLVNYAGEEIEIKENTLDLLVKPKIETDIFKTIDYIALQKKKQAIELLKKHLEKGDSPFYLLSMISYQFRNLLIVRELIEKNTSYYLISQKTNLHPYVIKKIYPLAKKFSLSELKRIYQKIFQVDLEIKVGKIKPEIALDLLIAQL